MNRLKLDPTAAALLLFALFYFFDRSGAAAALLPAVTAHELGHALLLRVHGAHLHRLRVTPVGLIIDYTGHLDRQGRLLSLAAGPLAGALYALAALRMGQAYAVLSGQISLLLTVYNLLPILPLDGGRILVELTGSVAARRISRMSSGVLFVLGLAALLRFGALTLPLSAFWLLLYNCL